MQNGHRMKLVWIRSASVNVTRYELTIRSEDEYHREKYIVEDVNGRKDQNEPVSFLAPITMESTIDYKINVYSLFDHGGVQVRSDALHGRVRNEGRGCLINPKVEQASKRKTMSMTDLKLQVILNMKIYILVQCQFYEKTNSKPSIQVGEKQSWKSSSDLDKESLINKQRLCKSPAEKENPEQSIGDGWKEEE